MNNDPKDWDTKVWMCEFEPDVNNPGINDSTSRIFHFPYGLWYETKVTGRPTGMQLVCLSLRPAHVLGLP